MQIYLAPLQGHTDWIFRESFTQHFGAFDKTFSPFIRVQDADFYRPGQCNDILPEHNRFQKPIPQFLGKDAKSFQTFENLCTQHGYTEVNINMGCPFPVVVNKKMGAGILSQPQLVSQLLEGVFAATKLKVSVKCRLGNENAEEFEQLIPVFNQFPFTELIIHPRVGKQQYKGEVDVDAFAHYAGLLNHPVCYNGDILNVADVQKIKEISPQIKSVMIGRGMLQNPFLLNEIRNQELTQTEKNSALRNFHLSIVELCKQKYSGDLHFLKRLEELWSYHYLCFEDGRKIYKQVKKCNTLTKYEGIVFKAINDLK